MIHIYVLKFTSLSYILLHSTTYIKINMMSLKSFTDLKIIIPDIIFFDVGIMRNYTITFTENIIRKMHPSSGSYFFCEKECCKNHSDRMAKVGIF